MPRKRVRITTEPEIRKLKRSKGHAIRYRIPAHDGKPESKSPWRKYPDAKTKALYLQAAEEYRQELEDEINDYAAKSDMELGIYAQKWHEDRKASGEILKPTWKREESLIAAIQQSSLAAVPLEEITAEDIDKFKAEGQKAGWSKDKQAKVLKKLKQILKFAESRKLIKNDPSRNIKNVKVIPDKRRSLTKAEQHRLLKSLDEEPKDSCRAAVRITIAAGLREGEALALQWQDLNLEAGGSYIALRRQLDRDGNLVPPKHNETGNIPIDDDTAAWLGEWKRISAERAGKERADMGSLPVCPNKKGGYLTLTNFARWWRKYRTDHELGTYDGEEFIPYKFHELRHTTATELIGEGADLKTVQAIMRHKSIRATEVYLHDINENMTEAVNKVARARREYDEKKEAAKKKHKPTRYSKGGTVQYNPEWN